MTKYFSNQSLFITLLIMIFIPNLTVAAQSDGIVNIPNEQLVWSTTAEGAAFSDLKGDRFKESYMAMVKLPAGIVSPMHVKTSNMYGVVISGTFSHIADGADPSTEKLLPAGSYYMIPAGLAHISKCVSKTECISFLFQDGKFDFIPVKSNFK